MLPGKKPSMLLPEFASHTTKAYNAEDIRTKTAK